MGCFFLRQSLGCTHRVSHMASHRGERVNGQQISRFPEVLLKAAVDLVIVPAVSPFYWSNRCSVSSLE